MASSGALDDDGRVQRLFKYKLNMFHHLLLLCQQQLALLLHILLPLLLNTPSPVRDVGDSGILPHRVLPLLCYTSPKGNPFNPKLLYSSLN